MFCPQLKVPWLRECVRNNSVSFPKAFSGFSLFRANPEEYDPMTTYISAWVDVLATWHYFKNFPLLSFNKRQTPLKNHLLFHIFYVVYMKKLNRSRKRQRILSVVPA